ncbi:probable serine/threonine-protein kinase kinX [Chironomus tepperi]|uniref:probable serine/threonine-protein kinase kinX n=1 Tax=Chironomus tepperi TaxID=113505 RepID=UPI00391F6AD3
MKSIIIAFALIVAVSCDVSHVVQGEGWSKDGSGYHYSKPEVRFESPDEVVPEEEPVVEIATEEPVEEPVTVVLTEEPANDYLPPANDIREYLPPKTEEVKRKRQVQGRKVYRRFAKKH